MISLLLPSRGRPGSLDRLLTSIEEMTVGSWEMIVRLDADDPALPAYEMVLEQFEPPLMFLVGERIVLSQLWNECAERASGDLLMHAGDDLVFQTPGWDRMARDAFPEDQIAFVHGDDLGGKGDWFGTHGIISRRWVDTVGYFVPPLFSSDYNDKWLNDVADMLGRRIFVPFVTEHMHPAFGKGEWDLTHRERIERHHADDVDRIWRESAPGRFRDATLLKAVIDGPGLTRRNG